MSTCLGRQGETGGKQAETGKEQGRNPMK